MKTFYISSSAWLGHKQACKSIAMRVIKTTTNYPDAIVIDMDTARRGCDHDMDASIPFFEIDFREWVSETLSETGTISIEAIRRAAATLMDKCFFVINATGFHASTIHSALHQLRIGLYSKEEWPLAIVLIGDDSQLHNTSPVLAQAFYVRPNFLGRTAIKTIARRIAIDAMHLRIFGKAPHAWISGKILNAIFSTTTIMIRSDEKKDIKRQSWNSIEG